MSVLQLVVIAVLASLVVSQNVVYDKVVLTEAATQTGAVCLDGTPGAYYFRPGTGSGARKWYIHHEGGGWCYNLDDCYNRAHTTLGSSSTYPNTVSMNSGYFSINEADNPLMYNWNSVYLKYCDGASFSGNNQTVESYRNEKLYFRGFRILRAMFEDLQTKKGLNMATDIVISGCSAGGLATYLHLDWWKSVVNPSARVVGMPDSGFFLDWEGKPNYHNNMIWVFTQSNSTEGVNQRCIQFYTPTKDEWHCIFAEHTSPFIVTPIFPLQSEYDSWQVPNDLGSSNVTDINEYGAHLVSLVRNSLLSKQQNSVFLDSCYHHCGDWNSIVINGLTQANAFAKWFAGDNSRWIQGQTYPCQSCCH